MSKRKLADFDTCVCGDYRHQHVNGVGACRLNGLGHGGPGLCRKFQIGEAATNIPKPYLSQTGEEPKT